MYQFDLTTLRGWISAVWQLIVGAMRLDPAAFEAAVASENGLLLGILVALVAGASLSLGQSMVLFANRVSPKRFLLSLASSAVMMTLVMVFWALSSWLIASFVMGSTHPVRDYVIVVALGSAPAVLGFWVLLPYLGNLLAWLLRAWIFLAILVGMGSVMTLGFWQDLIVCGAGWLLLELLTHLPIFDLDAWRAWYWRITTGQTEQLGAEELAIQLADEANLGLQAGNTAGTVTGTRNETSKELHS